MLDIFFPAVNGGMLVLIWLVQIIIYPGMHGWQEENFGRLHQVYWKQMFCIVTPIILVQGGVGLLLFLRQPGPVISLQMVLIAFAWIITFAYSVPSHSRLEKGYKKSEVNHLIRTNWLRTISWSGISLLDWVSFIPGL